ncbi:MAG: SDR family NAD(P)-dependent oxidoreductase [Methylotenera sp.]|nr:SDR family NAD(P)-dependent oxidoreductase [Oligoflexia bacterium]
MKPRSLFFEDARKVPCTAPAVVITGGTRGLAFLLAQKLLSGGAQVMICSRRSVDLESALAKLGGAIAVPPVLKEFVSGNHRWFRRV